MRKKLYEKRRQLKIKNQLQRESKKKIPIGKNEKITFDFDGSLMRMDNHHIKIKDAVRMKYTYRNSEQILQSTVKKW